MASKNNNRQMVPEARQALDDMKFEIARELGVDVKGYGGELLRDGFRVSVKAALGQDRGVSIRYGKTLSGLR